MKKLLISCSMLAAITSASAGFNGAQVGVSLGLGHMGADSKASFKTSGSGTFTGNGVSTWDFDTDHSKAHFSGGAFAKYTHMMGESATIGIDIFGRWQNVKSKTSRAHSPALVKSADQIDNILTTNDEIKSTLAFGGGLNLGMVMGSTHAYLKLGAVAARFKSNIDFTDKNFTYANSAIFDSDAAMGQVNVIPEEKKTKVGFAAGLGMEYAVNENIMIALEATHEVFGKIDTADITTTDPLAALLNTGAASTDAKDKYIVTGRSFRPRNTRIALNIGYKFM